jgi:hypothetical protein
MGPLAQGVVVAHYRSYGSADFNRFANDCTDIARNVPRLATAICHWFGSNVYFAQSMGIQGQSGVEAPYQ